MMGLHGRRKGPFEVGMREGESPESRFGCGVDSKAGAVDGGAGFDAMGFVDEAENSWHWCRWYWGNLLWFFKNCIRIPSVLLSGLTQSGLQTAKWPPDWY